MICLFFSATCCIVKVAQHFRWMQILFVKLTIYFDELWVSMKWIFQNAKSCFFLCWKLKIRKEFQEIKSLSSIQNMAAIVYENIHEKYTYFSYDSVQLNTLLMRARNFFLDNWVSQDIEIKIDKENVVGTFNLLWHIHGTQDIRDTEVQLYIYKLAFIRRFCVKDSFKYRQTCTVLYTFRNLSHPNSDSSSARDSSSRLNKSKSSSSPNCVSWSLSSEIIRRKKPYR